MGAGGGLGLVASLIFPLTNGNNKNDAALQPLPYFFAALFSIFVLGVTNLHLYVRRRAWIGVTMCPDHRIC